jgi:hypothetical protein
MARLVAAVCTFRVGLAEPLFFAVAMPCGPCRLGSQALLSSAALLGVVLHRVLCLATSAVCRGAPRALAEMCLAQLACLL